MTKKLFYFSLLFFLVFCSQISSQNIKVIDSLLIEIKKTKNDTTIINYYATIGSEYVNMDIVKSNYYSKLVLNKSKKNNYRKGIALYYYIKSKEFYNNGDYVNARKYIAIGKKTINDNQSDVYLDFCYVESLSYLLSAEYEKSIELAQHTLKTLRKGSTKYNQIGRLNFAISNSYTRNNQMEKSLEVLPIAISNFRKAKNGSGELSCYLELYNVNYLLGNDLKAYNAIVEALDIYKRNNLNSNSFLMSIYYKLGECYSRKNDFQKAIKYFKYALILNKELKYDFEQAAILRLLAEAYCFSGQYKKSIETVRLANKSITDDKLAIQFSYLLNAKSYYELKQYSLAKKYIDSAKINIPILKREGINYSSNKSYYQLLSLIQSKLGNYKEAYLNANKFSTMEIEDLKSEKAKRIEDLQEQFESKEKDLKLKNMMVYRQKKELETLQTNKKIIYLSTFIFLLSIGVVLFFIFYREKNKNNLLLQNKNKEIEKKNSDLLREKDGLRKSLQEKEVLLKEIHHRVKNNLQLVVSLLNIQSRVNKHPIVNEFIEKSQSRIISMSLIHQNLYNTEDISKIYFQNYLESLVDNLLNTFNNKLIKAKINTNGFYFDIQTAIPLGLIINEILCNSLKHAFIEGYKGNINVDLTKNDDIFTLIIGDDGKGIVENIKKKNAIGMDLVELLVLQMHAEISLIQGKGTKYEIKFKEQIKL